MVTTYLSGSSRPVVLFFDFLLLLMDHVVASCAIRDTAQTLVAEENALFSAWKDQIAVAQEAAKALEAHANRMCQIASRALPKTILYPEGGDVVLTLCWVEVAANGFIQDFRYKTDKGYFFTSLRDLIKLCPWIEPVCCREDTKEGGTLSFVNYSWPECPEDENSESYQECARDIAKAATENQAEFERLARAKYDATSKSDYMSQSMTCFRRVAKHRIARRVLKLLPRTIAPTYNLVGIEIACDYLVSAVTYDSGTSIWRRVDDSLSELGILSICSKKCFASTDFYVEELTAE